MASATSARLAALVLENDWATWPLSALQSAWAGFVHFWRAEVPELLRLLARSLAKAKIPTSLADASDFTMSDWLDAAPILAGTFCCAVTPMALLLGDHSKRAARGARAASGGDDADLRNSYWLTREVLLSGMGLCYLCGFLVSAVQHRALWGSLGLLPISRNPRGRPTPAFALLEHLGWGFGDWQLELVSWVGVALSFQLIVGRVRTFLVPAALWALYLSIVNLQAPFTYSYGWEWLTCEVGFLVIFLCPVAARGLASCTPPPRLVLWLIRWCAFRLLLGAGMSKVGRNSSACWRELSCTSTHYFTQPIPNPLSWYMHHLPAALHRVEVALTFVEQLVLPFLMLVPVRACRVLAAVLEIGFQLGIVGTGNYAWINFIGALPCISMLDDGVLAWLHPRRLVDDVRVATARSQSRRCCSRIYSALRLLVHLVLVAVMVQKSVAPIRELFGPAPWINSYDRWFLMNSQGVFGFINKHRVQLVLSYTHDAKPGSPNTDWRPLDFKCLPGDPKRRPCLLSPYHQRLDWETWIRVTASNEQLWEQRAPAEAYHQRLPEFLQDLVVRLLNGDDDAAGLMGVPLKELYKGGEPPTAILVDFASYTFADRADTSGAWWKATPVAQRSSWAYGREGSRLPAEQVRKSPRERHWVLGACALGVGAAVEVALMHSAVTGAVALPLLAHLFVIALATDYEDLWPFAQRFMPLAEAQPACLQLGTAARQRCGYEYARRCAAGYSGLVLLWVLSARRRPGVLGLLVCGVFPAVAYFSSSALA